MLRQETHQRDVDESVHSLVRWVVGTHKQRIIGAHSMIFKTFPNLRYLSIKKKKINLAKMAKLLKFGLANSLLDSPTLAIWLTLTGTQNNVNVLGAICGSEISMMDRCLRNLSFYGSILCAEIHGLRRYLWIELRGP